MAIARGGDNGLSALAQANPELLDDLKALTLLAMTGGGGGGGDQQQQPRDEGGAAAGPVPSAANVAELVRAVLHSSLGVPEPRLVALLRGLLGAHRAWFKVRGVTRVAC